MLEFHGPFVCMSSFAELPPGEPVFVEPDYHIIMPGDSSAAALPSFWERQTQPSGRAAFLTRKPPVVNEDIKTLMRNLRVLRIGCIIGAELDPANAWVPFLNGPVIEALVPWEFPTYGPRNFIIIDLYRPEADEILSEADQADAAEVDAWAEEFAAFPGFHPNSVLQFNE